MHEIVPSWDYFQIEILFKSTAKGYSYEYFCLESIFNTWVNAKFNLTEILCLYMEQKQIRIKNTVSNSCRFAFYLCNK